MIKTKAISTKKFFIKAVENSQITKKRTQLTQKIAQITAKEYIERGNQINLNFICTHNSRRSQLAQVWSFFAIEYFELKNIFTFSGGTSVTAFHRNTIKTLQKVGFEFNLIDFSHQNPKYFISFEGIKKSILVYSKLYDNPQNKYPYIAITTCNNADENCPFIPDAIHRFHLPYTDPKFSDNTDFQSEKYLEINRQIASEMFLLFSEIKKNIELKNTFF